MPIGAEARMTPPPPTPLLHGCPRELGRMAEAQCVRKDGTQTVADTVRARSRLSPALPLGSPLLRAPSLYCPLLARGARPLGRASAG